MHVKTIRLSSRTKLRYSLMSCPGQRKLFVKKVVYVFYNFRRNSGSNVKNLGNIYDIKLSGFFLNFSRQGILVTLSVSRLVLNKKILI